MKRVRGYVGMNSPCLVAAELQSSCGILLVCVTMSMFPFFLGHQSDWIADTPYFTVTSS